VGELPGHSFPQSVGYPPARYPCKIPNEVLWSWDKCIYEISSQLCRSWAGGAASKRKLPPIIAIYTAANLPIKNYVMHAILTRILNTWNYRQVEKNKYRIKISTVPPSQLSAEIFNIGPIKVLLK
jgi:hypothetical protein